MDRTLYRIIRTVDVAGTVEELAIPLAVGDEIDEIENTDQPYWDDSPRSWDISDFTNPAIYQEVSVRMEWRDQ